MRIGALAKAAGTTVATVRHYELAQLREVLALKRALGLSLDELREVTLGEAAPRAPEGAMAGKLEELEQDRCAAGAGCSSCFR
jgi:DNA-binding transcriptional MerR regulator